MIIQNNFTAARDSFPVGLYVNRYRRIVMEIYSNECASRCDELAGFSFYDWYIPDRLDQKTGGI